MKKTALLVTIFTVALTGLNYSAKAQNIMTDSISKKLNKIQSDIDLLKRVQISGYLQSQFQAVSSRGAASFEGGNFSANTDKRFMLRRTRVKIAYTTELTQFVFQIDGTEKGIAIKDMFLKITEPRLKAFSLTAGCMNRPFGYEIPYSSSMRESPERGRMSQIVMPGERDLGLMITFQMPKTSPLNFLKIEGGMFNGTGSGAVDFDYKKDFIGNVGINKKTKNEKINYAIRTSYYNGGFRQGTSKVFSIAKDSLGLNAFSQNNDTINFGAIGKRQYSGLDAQVNIAWPIGLTTIRAEYIQGKQPGTSSTNISPAAQPTGDTYKRNFNGAYFYFLQNIGQSKHQLVIKYDWYDPNTNVKGNEIGSKVNGPSGKTFVATGASDIKYSNVGIGWIYHWDTNVKITAYYNTVTNETSKSLVNWGKDLKDNVFTLRFQYKF